MSNPDPERFVRGQNPAFKACWNGFESYRPFFGDDLFSSPSLARAQRFVFSRKRAELPRSCVQLSLMAHARNLATIEWLSQQYWGAMRSDEAEGLLVEWAALFGFWVVVYGPRHSGWTNETRLTKVFETGDRSGRPARFLLLEALDGAAHMLPVSSINYDMAKTLPPPPFEGPPLFPSEVEPENTSTATLAELAPKSGFMPAEQAQGTFLPIFDGISTVPGPWRTRIELSDYRTSLPDIGCCLSMARPDVAHAVTDFADRHLENAFYYTVASCSRVWPVFSEAKVYTDGIRQYTAFEAGDVLDYGSTAYRVVPDTFRGVPVLRLVLIRASFWARLRLAARRLSPAMDAFPRRQARVVPSRASVPIGKAQEESYLFYLHQSLHKDPLVATGIKRVKEAVLEQEHHQPRPEAVGGMVRRLEEIRGGFPDGLVIAGRFAWGYCFACGVELPGKRMAGRLCNGCKINSPTPTPLTLAAKLVMDGEKPTTATSPIAYPGLVQLRSRDFPLKSGVETCVVEGGNFCVAP